MAIFIQGQFYIDMLAYWSGGICEGLHKVQTGKNPGTFGEYEVGKLIRTWMIPEVSYMASNCKKGMPLYCRGFFYMSYMHFCMGDVLGDTTHRY